MVLRRLCILIITLLLSAVLIRIWGTSSTVEENDVGLVPIAEGVYMGIGRGFVGDIIVEVTFEKSFNDECRMTRIDVLKSEEVKWYQTSVLKTLKPEVLEKQSTEIDAVTGATGTSRGFLEAVRNAKSKAYKGN